MASARAANRSGTTAQPVLQFARSAYRAGQRRMISPNPALAASLSHSASMRPSSAASLKVQQSSELLYFVGAISNARRINNSATDGPARLFPANQTPTGNVIDFS